MKRRALLALLGCAGAGMPGAGRAGPSEGGSARQRVVVVGGAWAGLSAARELRQLAPELDVLVIDRDPVMRCLPLSNPWLVGRTPERMPRLDRAALASQLGYRFVAAEVQRLDRAQRKVHTAQGAFAYDWLLVATGLAYDYSAWFGADQQAAAAAAQNLFPAGYVAHELDALKQRLQAFEGGNLVINVPAPPVRCPPAPYERAMLLAWWLKTNRIKGKVTVLDAGGGLPRFTRLFAERYSGLIDFQPHTVIRSIDPFAKRITTDDGDLPFDHAMLLPPMRASAVVEQAGLLGLDAQGKPGAWTAVDPLRLRAPSDERVFLAGDLLGTVSPLFGHYPKTAHMATRLGLAAARQIAARSRGAAATEPPLALPHSVCHVWLDADPAEQLRMETSYRLRGDGVIAQTVTQHDNPQPRDEDLQWGLGLIAQALGASV
jgi:NADPH-dependent 2,4-dienoyl-CoA reductase/sulfur reductase-like enzyme